MRRFLLSVVLVCSATVGWGQVRLISIENGETIYLDTVTKNDGRHVTVYADSNALPYGARCIGYLDHLSTGGDSAVAEAKGYAARAGGNAIRWEMQSQTNMSEGDYSVYMTFHKHFHLKHVFAVYVIPGSHTSH